VLNRSEFLPSDVLLAVLRVPETAGLVVGVIVQHGAPSVVVGVGMEVGGLDGFVDGPTCRCCEWEPCAITRGPAVASVLGGRVLPIHGEWRARC
jgi:hypothetical protein